MLEQLSSSIKMTPIIETYFANSIAKKIFSGV